MEVTFDTKTVPVVKWNVAIPRENSTVESKCFLMNGVRWKLRLGSKIVGDIFSSNLLTEKWIMRLIKDSQRNFPQFHLTLYIRHGVKDVFLAETKISSANTEIWSSSCSSFRTNYPQIPVAGNALLFVLDFHGVDEDNNQRNPPKVHKSIQATDSPVCSDVNTCLENLSLDMSKLMAESPDADVQLKCGDLTIGAHKLIGSSFRSVPNYDAERHAGGARGGRRNSRHGTQSLRNLRPLHLYRDTARAHRRHHPVAVRSCRQVPGGWFGQAKQPPLVQNPVARERPRNSCDS